MKILIKNGRVIDPGSGFDEVCDVAIAAGRIVSLKNTPADFAPNKTMDATGCVVAPGLIDLSAGCASLGMNTKACLKANWRPPWPAA